MLLKDCPVGSVVRLVGICGLQNDLSHWSGVFEVFNDGGENFVIDGDGEKRFDIEEDDSYQFEAVRTLTLSGTTYALTPYEAPKLVTIDGVVYVMTEMV